MDKEEDTVSYQPICTIPTCALVPKLQRFVSVLISTVLANFGRFSQYQVYQLIPKKKKIAVNPKRSTDINRY